MRGEPRSYFICRWAAADVSSTGTTNSEALPRDKREKKPKKKLQTIDMDAELGLSSGSTHLSKQMSTTHFSTTTSPSHGRPPNTSATQATAPGAQQRPSKSARAAPTSQISSTQPAPPSQTIPPATTEPPTAQQPSHSQTQQHGSSPVWTSCNPYPSQPSTPPQP
ncbi:unnamed protein product [Aspergillus oryzae RIB40]|uniref:DNA, SC111 n=1 Tax=Aspergillus oryzae (strain ATCC 42149 / RIB 40) TaxID=510516 RepID=Q2U830_ASPOR|nr:unnamed protein product [Aspergillus oryzae RIB40]BAE62285.1 unnamed protein product [Aspergillus oryzae RIB40]